MKQRSLKIVFFLFLMSVWGVLGAGNWDYFFSSNTVTALCPIDGINWIGTTSGLIRMDPVSGKLTHYHVYNSSLPSNYVLSVFEGWDGRIWVGTYEGLASFDGINWEVWSPDRLGLDESKPECYWVDYVSSMTTDQDRNVWTCLQSRGGENDSDIVNRETVVVKITPSSVDWEYFEFDFDLIGCSQGLLLGATRYGGDRFEDVPNDKIFVYDGTSSVFVDLDLGLDSVKYALHKNGDLIIMQDLSDSIIGRDRLFIHRNVARGVSPDRVEELAIPGNKVQFISSEVRGNVFAIIDNKPWSWSGNGWTYLSESENAWMYLSDLASKYEKWPEFYLDCYCSLPVFAGTANGKTLAAVGNIFWDGATNKTHYIHPSGLAVVSEAFDMVIDRDGVAWFTTKGGLVSYDGAEWVLIPYPFGDIQDDGVALTVNSRGSVWLQHQDDVYSVENGSLAWKKEIPGLLEISFDPGDNLWALCDDEVLCMKDGKWEQISVPESSSHANGFNKLLIDPTGKVWVLGHKIHSFNGSSWVTIDLPTPHYDYVREFCVDSKGIPWYLGEIYRYSYYDYKGQKWYQEETPNSSYICASAADKKGGWWCWTGFADSQNGQAYHHNGKNITLVPDSKWGFSTNIYIDANNNKWLMMDYEIAVYNEDGIVYPFPNQAIESVEMSTEPLNLPPGALMAFNAVKNESSYPTPRYVAFPYKKGNQAGFVRKDLESGPAVFSVSDFASSGLAPADLNRVELWDANGKPIGHMIVNWDINSRIRGTFIVSKQHVPGDPLWEYYVDGEHMVSLLIQPEEIRPGRKPLVLVHGIGGSYPYFSEPFMSQLNANPDRGDMFDIWQFYYPYDQQIEHSSPMLGKALDIVQSRGYRQNNGRVNILAHSMGGLVTRALIQNLNPEFGYQNNIEKFCMLGTPNHGSHSAFRISHFSDYPTSYLYNDWNDLQDQYSPAIRQLYPGSAFLTALNLLPPNRLYPGSDISDSYLVVAGTHNRFHPWVAESSLEFIDDIVVAVPSASLMDFGIPLATVYYDHMGLAGEIKNDGSSMDSSFLADFFADDYSPEQTDLSSYFTNFWLSPPGAGTDPLASILNVRIEGVKRSNPLRVIIDAQDRVVKLYMGLVDQVAGELLPQQMKRDLIPCEIDEDNSITYTFMENEPGASILSGTNLSDVKYLASPLDPGSYRVELYDARKDLIWANNDYLNVQNGCTSSIEIILSGDIPSGDQDGNNTSSTSVPKGMVYVPGGTFTMGNTHGSGDSDELPTHTVTLNSYYIGKYEVTQAEYSQYMQPGSSWTSNYGLGDDYPAYYVSWYAILKYCNLRSMAEGLTPVYSISGSTNPANWGSVPTSNNSTWNAAICNWNATGYRLPTEAEWEYAARGGTNSPDYLYSGSNDINAVAWYDGNNSPYGSKPVGTKAPNGIGTYDMSGNLWEWCWDWYSSSYYSSSPQNNPTGPNSGSYRLLRGGNWYYYATDCRVANRDSYSPYYSYSYSGFRLCRAIN